LLRISESSRTWFDCRAHPPVNIGICAGGYNAADGPKDKQGCLIISYLYPETLGAGTVPT